jgi:lytic cellulose monooxygenase (C1-hydroxylating)
MRSFSSVILALTTSVGFVSAHGFVKSVVINGETISGFDVSHDPWVSGEKPKRVGWTNTVTDTGFVDPSGYSHPNIICHRDATNGAISATVAAGDQISLVWNSWPESHHGPVLDYLADCGESCATVDKNSLKFFKFNEGGLIDPSVAPTGKWAADTINAANGFTWTTTIPATLKPGNYVLRHEIIALHASQDLNGAQNYPQCINLKVTGSGTELPAGIPATQLYTAQDPGIHVNIYWPRLTSYTIPGPAIAIGSSSSSDIVTIPADSGVKVTSPSSASPDTSAVTASDVATRPTQAPSASKGGCRAHRHHARQLGVSES